MKLAIVAACLLTAAPLEAQAQFRGPPLPPGYGYAPGSMTPRALDPCAQPGIAAGLARLIDAQAHLPKHVVRFDEVKSPEPDTNIDTTQPNLTCHGTLVFADGGSQAGIVFSHDPGGAAQVRVTWNPDCWGRPYYVFGGRCPAARPFGDYTNGYVPQWIKIAHSNDFAVYLDQKARRQGTISSDHPNTIEVSALTDFNSEQDWGNGPVWSVVSRVRLDCAVHQMLTIDHVSHNAHMGDGDDVAEGSAGDQWHTPASGTPDDFILYRGCKGS